MIKILMASLLLAASSNCSKSIDVESSIRYNVKTKKSDENNASLVHVDFNVVDDLNEAILNAKIAVKHIHSEIKSPQLLGTDYSGFARENISPGKYVFHVSYINHESVTTDTLDIVLGKDYTINFKLPEYRVQTLKPVIYLYPEKTTPFSLTVKNCGDLEFVYPLGKPEWKGTAHPNGEMEINGKKHDYLFWDAQQKQSDFKAYTDIGTVVKKKDIIDFLEASLTTLALNSREQQDFISFWAPKMMRHDNVQVTFLVNNDYGVVSENTIYPTPDTEIRVFMLFSPVLPIVELTPQNLPVLERKGFTVVEWGGAEMMNFEMP